MPSTINPHSLQLIGYNNGFEDGLLSYNMKSVVQEAITIILPRNKANVTATI